MYPNYAQKNLKLFGKDIAYILSIYNFFKDLTLNTFKVIPNHR